MQKAQAREELNLSEIIKESVIEETSRGEGCMEE
jgi:hypothetical protein